MQHSAFRRKRQYQTTWPIFIVWVILNYFALMQECLLKLLHADIPGNTRVNGMF